MNAKRLFLGLLTATLVLAPLATLKSASAGEALSPAGRVTARSKAIQDVRYKQLGQRIQQLTTRLQRMKPDQPLRAKNAAEIQDINREREAIVRRYEDQQGRQERALKLTPAKHLPRP